MTTSEIVLVVFMVGLFIPGSVALGFYIHPMLGWVWLTGWVLVLIRLSIEFA